MLKQNGRKFLKAESNFTFPSETWNEAVQFWWRFRQFFAVNDLMMHNEGTLYTASRPQPHKIYTKIEKNPTDARYSSETID